MAPPAFEFNKWRYFYITYRCSNCRNTEKTFSLAGCWEEGATSGKCYKIGGASRVRTSDGLPTDQANRS